MKRYSVVLMTLTSVCVIIFATAVQAAEWTAWTFQVPVELTNVPSTISKGTVACMACVDNATVDSYGNIICNLASHAHSTDFPITGGRYSGTVTVPVNTKDGINPYSAKSWACRVNLYTSTGVTFASQAMTPDPSKPLKEVISGLLK
jgi:hypothetical protein